MNLSVTILLGSYRATARETQRGFYVEQPGDLVITVEAKDVPSNTSVPLLLDDLIGKAREAAFSMTKTVIHGQGLVGEGT